MKNVCWEACKAAASIVATLGPGGPDNALCLLEDLTQPLACIGVKYPELSVDAASLLMRINNKFQGGGGGGVGNKWDGHKGGYGNSSAVAQEALEMLMAVESGVTHLSSTQ